MSKMNLPNKLTMLRLCLVPVMMVFLLLPASILPTFLCYGIGLVLFVVTSLTDMLDGKIARARNLITNFGKFMDPVADKFMVIGTMLALLFRMLNPGLYGLMYPFLFKTLYFIAVVMIIFRELAITSLRLVLVNASGVVVAANMLGKIKTVSQIVCICTLFIEPLLSRIFEVFSLGILSYTTIIVTLVFTVLSGIKYIAGGWKFISTNW